MADSTSVLGTPVTPAAVGAAADTSSPNGNGHSEVVADGGSVILSLADPSAVLRYTGNGDIGLTTGYTQSDTAGRGVISISTNQGFSYNGSGSTLVGLANATAADILFIAARSLTMTTGTLTALGAGSTALAATANGGVGLGTIGVTVDGDISSAGSAVVIDQNDTAATGNVMLTSTAGNSITSGAGQAVTVITSGSGTVTIDLAGAVSATGGDGISVRDLATGGNLSISTAAVSAAGAGSDAIDAKSASLNADLTIVANGVLVAGDDGIVAMILNTSANGNVSVTTNASVDAGANGIEAVNFGSGTVTVSAARTVAATDGGDGIIAVSSGGAISVTAGAAVTSTAEQGIDLQQTNAARNGALSVSANGDVTGTDAIRVLNSGLGAVTVATTASLTGVSGDAILVVSSHAAAGAIGVTTAAGEVLSANLGNGVDIDQAGSGNVTVNSAAHIASGANPNRLQAGIDVSSTGTGSIAIANSGTIGSAADRAQLSGINAVIANAASGGNLSVTGNNAIFAAQNGIDLFTSGSGAASVNYSGAVNAASGDAIQLDTTSGALTVVNGGATTAAAGYGIRTISTSGNQSITVNAAVDGGGLDGVFASAGSGTITVNVDGGDVTGVDDAVQVTGSGAKTVNVAVGRTLTGGDLGIASIGTGATTINNGGTINGNGVAIRSENAATTVNNLATGTINGAISLSALIDTVTNAGTINGALDLGAGNDVYDGRNGSISGMVTGGAGDDTLLGGAAVDRLSGGLGVDILSGNGGADILTGGAGNDVFRGLASGLNGDTIADFTAGDTIVISDAVLGGFIFSRSGNTLTYTGGSLTLTGFTGTLQASTAVNGGVQLTVVPSQDARNDFNGDGRSDILWRHDNGAIFNFLGTANGGVVNNGDNIYTVVDNIWDMAGTGDFNGDGRDDILWRQDNGAIFNFLGTPNGGVANNGDNSYMALNATWRVAGIGDFNGDQRDDILWRDANGVIFDYLGTASGGFVDNSNNLFTDVGDEWHAAGIGDFNGDGKDDILWRNDNGAIFNFLGTASGGVVNNGDNIYTVVDNVWHVAGIGDFNGDGRDDILWRNDNGAVFNFLGTTNGGVQNNGDNSYTAMNLAWSIEAIGDYNGDGSDDILWRDASGTIIDWLGTANGSFVDNSNNLTTNVGTQWHVEPQNWLLF